MRCTVRVLLLPASLYQVVSRLPNPKTCGIVTVFRVGLIVLGVALFSSDQQAKKETS